MSVTRFDIARHDYDDYEMVAAPNGDWVEVASVKKLSTALADMIAMYESKKRDGIRLGKARAALNFHGIRPESPVSEEANP